MRFPLRSLGLVFLVLAAPGARGGTRTGSFDLVFETTSPGTTSYIAVAQNAKGRGRRLMPPTRDDSSPSASLSGDLALASDETSHWQIFITDPSGGNRRPLSPSQSSQFDPVWSPDGEYVAFESKRKKSKWQISVSSVNGDQAFVVTHNRINHFDPAWSPDGKDIVYASVRNGRSDLYITSATPSNHPRRLTRTRASEFDPSWSPDGGLIAFDRLKDGDYDIWTVKAANGTPVSHLTYGATNDSDPTWSPDGERIAFESDRTDDYDIWVVNADGSGLHDVTRNPASIDLIPTWRMHMSALLTFARRSSDTTHGCDTLQPDQHVGNRIYGTAGVDWLCGTPSTDRIYGEQGADHINGKYGHDYIYGGAGGDAILAQDGLRDRLYGGEPHTSDRSRVDWALADKNLDKRFGVDALKP
jgi:dipeptidyl aminopeptidase/acylaminoacyl peptidase